MACVVGLAFSKPNFNFFLALILLAFFLPVLVSSTISLVFAALRRAFQCGRFCRCFSCALLAVIFLGVAFVGFVGLGRLFALRGLPLSVGHQFLGFGVVKTSYIGFSSCWSRVPACRVSSIVVCRAANFRSIRHFGRSIELLFAGVGIGSKLPRYMISAYVAGWELSYHTILNIIK